MVSIDIFHISFGMRSPIQEPQPGLSIADEGLTVLEGAVEGPTAVE
jgi:hypothetical protein